MWRILQNMCVFEMMIWCDVIIRLLLGLNTIYCDDDSEDNKKIEYNNNTYTQVHNGPKRPNPIVLQCSIQTRPAPVLGAATWHRKLPTNEPSVCFMPSAVVGGRWLATFLHQHFIRLRRGVTVDNFFGIHSSSEDIATRHRNGDIEYLIFQYRHFGA